MQRNVLTLLAALAVSLVSMQLGTAAAGAKIHSFPIVREHRGVLTFKMRGLDARRIRSARVVTPRRQALNVNRRTVQRAARRGVLRLRVSRRWLRANTRMGEKRAGTGIGARTTRHARGRHRLRVITDLTAPKTTITAGATGSTSSTDVGFSFSSSESNSTFECRLDAGTWAACASPSSYSGLATGGHTFEVRAKDAVGNLDATPAARSFTIQSTTATTNPPPASGANAVTTAVGAPILKDADAAARVKRSSFEPRSRNATANQRVPTAGELSRFVTYSPNWGSCGEALKARITGNFTGTTDEIIQWAAHKWGIDADIVRAVALKESNWNQDARGDWDSSIADYQSYGLTQVRRNSQGESAPNWDGTFPLSRDSTAFNLDFWGASVRQYYEGCSTWLHDVGGNGASYRTGDIWGSVGAWYAGRWWNGDAQWYIGEVKANVVTRTWALPTF